MNQPATAATVKTINGLGFAAEPIAVPTMPARVAATEASKFDVEAAGAGGASVCAS